MRIQLESFRRMIQGMPDPVSVNELPGGAYVEVNEAWSRFTGYSRSEALGKSPVRLELWANRDQFERFMRALEEIGSVQNFAADFRVRAGIRNGSISAMILDLDGRSSVVSWTRDVTEQRRTEELRRDFVRMLSHDIKNPLAAILGFAEIMRDEASENATLREAIDAIESNAHQAVAIALNFLDADRIESGALEVSRASASVNKIVEHVLRHQSARARRRRLTLRTELEPVMPTMEIDEPLVDRAIANLVNNAIKFSPESGTVTVTTKSTPADVRIEVCDQGPGIALEARAKLFERYVRGSATRRDSTGLGLFIVRTIAEAHGGTVSLDCPSEGGSVFTFTLPRASN